MSTSTRLLIASGIGTLTLAALAAAARPAQEGAPGAAPPPVQEPTQEPAQEPAQGDPHEHDHEHGAGVEVGEDQAPIVVPIPGITSEGNAASDAQAEMVALFGRVERNLRKIDVLLSDAGAGDTEKLADVGEAGIGLLLNRSLDSGREALKDIDRILEIAEQLGQQQGSPQPGQCPECASGSCSKGHTGGGKPSDGQPGDPSSPLDRGQQSTERESTPDKPGGEEPGKEGEKPNESQDPKGGEPLSGQEADDPNPENEVGGDPPAIAVEGAMRPPMASERWGDLPVQARDIFLTEGDRHLPAQYRDWIDSYYRRLNESRPR